MDLRREVLAEVPGVEKHAKIPSQRACSVQASPGSPYHLLSPPGDFGGSGVNLVRGTRGTWTQISAENVTYRGRSLHAGPCIPCLKGQVELDRSSRTTDGHLGLFLQKECLGPEACEAQFRKFHGRGIVNSLCFEVF